MKNHLFYHFLKGYLRGPAKPFPGFGGVSKQGLHFCRPEIAGIDLNPHSSLLILSHFIYALPIPVELNPKLCKGQLAEVPHAVLLSRSYYKILRLILLQHQPLHAHEVPGMAPVSFGIQVTQIKRTLKAQGYSGGCPGNLAGYKGLASNG